jgi:peroxiredoxin
VNKYRKTPSGRAVFLILCIAALFVPSIVAAEIGSRIGSFHLTDVFGTVRSSHLFSGKAIVLVFWSFKCPVSLAYNDRMEEFQKKYKDKGVLIFGVAASSNESPEEIRANLKNLNLTVPVLLDAGGVLAEKLEATHTPEVFVLDGTMVLRYKGAWDNNKRVGESGRIAYVENTTEAILAKQTLVQAETKPFGCGIRRRGIRK